MKSLSKYLSVVVAFVFFLSNLSYADYLAPRSFTERVEILTSGLFQSRSHIGNIATTLLPVIEKSHTLKNLDEFTAWTRAQVPGLEIDTFNILHWHNGFVVVPVEIEGQWHYLFYRNRDSINPEDIARILQASDNWDRNEHYHGVVTDQLDLFVTTRKGMENIIRQEAMNTKYGAIYTDVDETLTPSKPRKINPEIARRFLELREQGTIIAFGTARRTRTAVQSLLRDFEAAGVDIPDEMLEWAPGKEYTRIEALVGMRVYGENAGICFDLGTGHYYMKQELTDSAKEAVDALLDEAQTGDEFEFDKKKPVDTEYFTRRRVQLKDDETMKRFIDYMNVKVAELNTILDQRLKVVRGSENKPIVDIVIESVGKIVGLEQFSEETGVPVHRIGKFGDRNLSGQYETDDIRDRALFQGNDFVMTRLPGGFSAGASDESAIFPITSEAEADIATLGFLRDMKFVPAPKPAGVFIGAHIEGLDPVEHINHLNQKRRQSSGIETDEDGIIRSLKRGQLDGQLQTAVEDPLARYSESQGNVEAHFVPLDTLEKGKTKIREHSRQRYWANLAMGRPVIVAIHGGAGVGKSETAKTVLEDLQDDLGISSGRVCRLDDYMVQRNRRKLVGTKMQMDLFARNMQALRRGEPAIKPMFDDQTGGNLLFGRDEEGNIIIYNGNCTVVITLAEGQFTYQKLRKLGADTEPETTKKCQFTSGTTPIEIELQEDKSLMVSIRGNKHYIKSSPDSSNIEISLPDGAIEKLTANPDEQVVAQDVLQPTGLIVIEGTRILNDKSLLELFDITVELWGDFGVRGSRYIVRTIARGRPPKEIEDDVVKFKEKQTGSELENLPAGENADIHIAVHTLSEAIWHQYQTGNLEALTRLEEIGIDQEKLVRELQEIERQRIIQVILDHVAREGKISYPEAEEGVEVTADDQKGRFSSQSSAYDTLMAGFLEIKVSQGKSYLDEELIANYEKLKSRTNRVMDPGEIVDLSAAGPIPVERNGKIEYITLGKVLVQSHIGWLEGPCQTEDTAKAKEYIDKFFNMQQLMWRRGIVDVNPDIMWRYGILFIGDTEEIVATSPSSMRTGAQALEEFNPRAYLDPAIFARIPKGLKSYYRRKVQERIFDVIGYRKPADLERARAVLYSNFFENDLPENMRTPKEELPVFLAGTGKIFPSEQIDRTEPLANINVSHPYIDSAQIDYINHWVLINRIVTLRTKFLKMCDTDTADIMMVWAKLVLEAERDEFSDFYKLMSVFYDLLLEYPDLMQRAFNQEVMNLVYKTYRREYDERGEAPFIIQAFAWDAFSLFLDQGRELDASREVRKESLSPTDLQQIAGEKAGQEVQAAIRAGQDRVFEITERFPVPTVTMNGQGSIAAATGFIAESSGVAPCYIVSSKPKIVTRQEMVRIGLTEFDNVIFVALKDSAYSNPALRIMEIVKQAKVSPARILVMDDDPEMIKAAVLMGCPTVGIVPNNGDRREQIAAEFIAAGADVIITGFKQQKALLSAAGLKVEPLDMLQARVVARAGDTFGPVRPGITHRLMRATNTML